LLPTLQILTVNDVQQLWGFEMTPARQAKLEIKIENVSDPLEMIKSRPGEYLMVLADMRMRSMNGLQLAKAVKNADQSLKVAIMTLYSRKRRTQARSYLRSASTPLWSSPCRRQA
jgi:DNA-binding NtrC family response regulator